MQMEDLRKIGGEAGVIAGLAMGWLVLGMMVVLPAAGLSFGNQLNPHKFLTFVHGHGYMFWSVNILGGLLAAVMSIILYLAVGDRFANDAPASARIGALLGVLGAFGFAMAALLRQFGIGSLASLYIANQVGAVHAFRGLSGTLSAITASGAVFTGFAALAFARAMMAEKEYRNVGLLALGTGAAMVLAAFIPNRSLVVISSLAAAAWFAWTALVLRSEAGAAFFRWQLAPRETRSRRAA
jgi:hypothetical protein